MSRLSGGARGGGCGAPCHFVADPSPLRCLGQAVFFVFWVRLAFVCLRMLCLRSIFRLCLARHQIDKLSVFFFWQQTSDYVCCIKSVLWLNHSFTLSHLVYIVSELRFHNIILQIFWFLYFFVSFLSARKGLCLSISALCLLFLQAIIP